MTRFAPLKLVALLALVGLFAPVAQGAVVFGYEVNQSMPENMFDYSGGGVGATLTADANVDFSVQFDTIPGVTMFDNAVLDFDATQVDGNDLGFANILYFDGSYSLTDSVTGDLIVTGNFTRAHMLLLDSTTSAALSISSEEISLGGILDLVAGPALQNLAEGTGVVGGGLTLQLVPAEDTAFTLTNITPPTDAINGFTANSSYSGNANTDVIPEPATLVLLGLGGLGVLARRRRRA